MNSPTKTLDGLGGVSSHAPVERGNVKQRPVSAVLYHKRGGASQEGRSITRREVHHKKGGAWRKSITRREEHHKKGGTWSKRGGASQEGSKRGGEGEEHHERGGVS